MKVFLSWSGARSHKVALVFREWLPSVIQEIIPYVSSEDIDKGSRWSTDIAKELSDSTFGILCVTRENVNAPWLTFEAGALSKTMDKSFVSPFLFDIKRSEVDGPILQFQSTIFEKEDLKKLVTTLNKACEEYGLDLERLAKAFDVWYPSLEAELNKLRNITQEDPDVEGGQELNTPKTQEILEEILELSRINQKLIRNPDGTLESNLEDMTNMLRSILDRSEKLDGPFAQRRMRKLHPMMLDELMHISSADGNGLVGAQMALGLVRSQTPWIYDVGIETINILRSRRGIEEKHEAIRHFQRVMEFSFNHPLMHEIFCGSRDMRFMYRRLHAILIDVFQKTSEG